MAALRGAWRPLSNGRVLFGKPNSNGRAPLLLPSQLVSFRGIASKLFVGGISFYTTEEALSEAFSQYGQVIEAKIIMDRASERSKGFGFVTFASEDEAKTARTEMNGKVLNGRVIFVDNAKAKLRFNDPLPVARGPPEPSGNK
ncbi:small RNA-binding protein 11, chloroplastic-like [Phoenix dactylifera]|uniref:Small RNA-binding protein 11, chloroplastic-like n=1 Tax=Phoenix dactylifera TaxID=42345 RepID=A0A8B7BRW0_PHODC|nr:small RNA-binding protein 11, chloroplastic-like [Phoenix dactylifera]